MRIALGIVILASVALAGCSCEQLALSLVDAPCYGDDMERCRQAQYALQDVGQDECAGTGRRLCLAPVGLVSPELMQHLAQHYRAQYGIDVKILRPIGVAPMLVDGDREQVSGTNLIETIRAIFPRYADDPNAVFIGVTPLDIYWEGKTEWPFVFGVRQTSEDPKAIVSTFRMNPETFGEEPDDDLLISRARKMTSKYVGMLYYELPESDDADSPLYNRIYSVDALDNVDEPLPAAAAR